MESDDEVKQMTTSDRVLPLERYLDGVDDPMLEHAAIAWHEAERHGGSNGRAPWDLCTEDERASARRRAEQVLLGEVLWSEAGIGDRTIWEGRSASRNAFRRAAAHLRRARAPGMVRGALAGRSMDTTIVPWKMYDTVYIRPGRSYENSSSHRLFGNANVGAHDLTNLWIPGQLSYGSGNAFFLSDLYLTYSPNTERWALTEVLEKAMLCLTAGEMQRTPWVHAADLVMGARSWSDRLPVDLLIPAHQSVSVTLDFIPQIYDRIAKPFALVVHLEGAMLRSRC